MGNDFLYDENYEDIIRNGDFLVDNSDDLNIQLILKSSIGHFRQTPLFGYGVDKLINGQLTFKDKDDIRNILSQDGYVVSLVYQNPETKEIEIKYN